ncbi:MAG: laccase domain-containing protein, partial [Clostridiales bacterium]
MNNNSFFSPINPSMEYHIKNGLAFFTCSPLAELDFLNHAFTTRLGGISKREFASLNLGLKTTDNKENIQENYRL